MDLTRLQRLARKMDELDTAWSRFDSVQAEREAEIRRPAKHIDVMSDNEYNRIQDAKGYVRDRLSELINTRSRQLETTSDLVYRFFAGDDSKEVDGGIKHIADCVSGTLVLRSQARSNPFFKDPPPGRAKPRKVPESSTEEEGEPTEEDLEKIAKELNIPLEDVQKYASIRAERMNDDSDLMIRLNTETHPKASTSRVESLCDFATHISIYANHVPGNLDTVVMKIVAEQGEPLVGAVIAQLKTDFEADKYPSETEKKTLEAFFANEVAQKAMKALISECAMWFNDLAETCVKVIRAADEYVPENAKDRQPVPKKQYNELLDQARKEMFDFIGRSRDYFK
ncbi:hypothetical protein MaudCBS49596_000361 [Microsporum audouinii]